MKIAIILPCYDELSVAAAGLSHLAAVTFPSARLIIGDANRETLWSDLACRAALKELSRSVELDYSITEPKGSPLNRVELFDKLNGDEDVILSIDQDALLPHNFATESIRIMSQVNTWGFIGTLHREPSDTPEIRNTWQADVNYGNVLIPSYSANGACVWLNGNAFRDIYPKVRSLMTFFDYCEDGILTMPIASKYPSFTLKSPVIRHYRTLTSWEDANKDMRVKQQAVLFALRSRSLLSNEVESWFIERMRENRWSGLE